MKTTWTAVLLVLLGANIVAHAEDPIWAQKVHRLEYIHFNPVQHTVEWGISGGTVNDAGEFVPCDSGISTYTLNLSDGTVTHNGEDGVLSSGGIVSALRAFGGVSQLMQGFTENFEGVSPSPANATEEKESDGVDSLPESRQDIASAFGLALISQSSLPIVKKKSPTGVALGSSRQARSGHYRAARAPQSSVTATAESAVH